MYSDVNCCSPVTLPFPAQGCAGFVSLCFHTVSSPHWGQRVWFCLWWVCDGERVHSAEDTNVGTVPALFAGGCVLIDVLTDLVCRGNS